MARPAKTPPQTPVTARAVCLGLLASIAIDLAMNYNDYYLNNSLLNGNHFPPIAIILVLALVAGVNASATRWFGVAGLAAGELILIWGMVGIAGGVCAAGMMRYFPAWMVNATYYASPSNDYRKYIVDFLPRWMILSREPNEAVRWFMEGLPAGASVPWGAWIVPMACWGLFALFLYASNFALVTFFYHQWSARERLIFPVVQLPVTLSAEAPPGRAVNEFLANPLTWAGVAVPCLLWGWNGLSTYVHGLPVIPTSISLWSIFPDRPWSEFRLEGANLYFSVIGMTYLLTTEMGFTLWGSYVLYKLSFAFIAWLGSGATGYWGNWGNSVSVFDTAGAIVALAVFLFWSARRGIGEWWGRLLGGRADPERDPLPPWVTLLLGAGGLLGMFAWLWIAGAQWWAAALTVGMGLAVLLILTRVVAESGLFFVQSNVNPSALVMGLVPPAAIQGGTLATVLLARSILFDDLREIFMPYLVNGLKACGEARLRLRPVLAVFAVTVLVALGISAYARISTAYKYGGVNLDWYANIGQPDDHLGAVATFQKNPPSFDWMEVGGVKVCPVNLAHVLTGAAAAVGLLVLRARFIWWPLHPFGIVMCGTWAMSMFWFSILLGNLVKSSVMWFGGASVYRKLLPLFLGLILGECLISVVWMLLGLVTGVPGRPILPN